MDILLTVTHFLGAFTTCMSISPWSAEHAGMRQWRLGYGLYFLVHVSLLLADISPDYVCKKLISQYLEITECPRLALWRAGFSGVLTVRWVTVVRARLTKTMFNFHFIFPAFLQLVMSCACHHSHLIQLLSISKCSEASLLWSPYTEANYSRSCCWWKVN